MRLKEREGESSKWPITEPVWACMGVFCANTVSNIVHGPDQEKDKERRKENKTEIQVLDGRGY